MYIVGLSTLNSSMYLRICVQIMALFTIPPGEGVLGSFRPDPGLGCRLFEANPLPGGPWTLAGS